MSTWRYYIPLVNNVLVLLPDFSVLHQGFAFTSGQQNLTTRVLLPQVCTKFYLHPFSWKYSPMSLSVTGTSIPPLKPCLFSSHSLLKKHSQRRFEANGASENPIGAVILYCSCNIAFQLLGKVALFLCLGFMAANWQGDKLYVAQGSVVMMS